MRVISRRPEVLFLLAVLAIPASGSVSAQEQPQDLSPERIVVNGMRTPDMPKGPEIKGMISARASDRIQVTAADGTNTIIAVDDATRIIASKGLFGASRSKLGTESLLNGLPVTVRTLQAGDSLVADQITLRGSDLKVATMIRSGTAQGFAEQTAATEALRGRLGDIDKYNVKSTTNVYFDTGKSALTYQAKSEICGIAAEAEGIENALMLVVGYTDSTGSEEFNQTLSEKRAASVINYLQQACRWKPYRMLTPTGMAASDPLASNDTPEGKAQNRRVSVNILVSKSLDGL